MVINHDYVADLSQNFIETGSKNYEIHKKIPVVPPYNKSGPSYMGVNFLFIIEAYLTTVISNFLLLHKLFCSQYGMGSDAMTDGQ